MRGEPESQALVDDSQAEPIVDDNPPEDAPAVMDEAQPSGEEPTIEDLFGDQESGGSDISDTEQVWNHVSWFFYTTSYNMTSNMN